jgi:membrane protease YdiL (CAAX protease family)
MVIIVELVTLFTLLYISRKDLNKIFHFRRNSLFAGVVVGVVYSLLIYIGKQTSVGVSTIHQFINGIKVPFFILYIIYPLVIAFAEEFIFRYFIASRLGVIFAAVLFTILHWRPNFPALLFLPVFILALSQSWLFNKTKSLIPLIIVHLFVTYALLLL